MLMNSFFIASIIVILIPGTGFVYTISTGITKGKRSGVYASIGCTLAIIPHMIIGILAMVFLTKVNEIVFQSIKVVGAIYLVYLGITMISCKATLEMEKGDKELSDFMIGLKGLFINLLNPKLTIFFLAFIPQYVNKEIGSIILQGMILDSIFFILSFFIFVVYALLAGSLHHLVETATEKIIWMQRIAGILFLIFSVQMLI
jgi:threonine/homoserine/homoserine lactone efflux protein